MIQPIDDCVLIDEQENVEEAGIVLSGSESSSTPRRGKVVATGDGRVTEEGNIIPNGVEVGDIVYTERYGNVSEVYFNAKKYLIVRANSIIAKEVDSAT